MSNRANFLIHIHAAFVMVLLFAAHAGLVVHYLFVDTQLYPYLLAMSCMAASLWLFLRMVIHCLEAVGREVDAARRRENYTGNPTTALRPR